jgi:DNA-binding beta-propeller fold protein YncE
VIVPYSRPRWRRARRRVGALIAGAGVVAGALVGGAVTASLAGAPGCETSSPPESRAAAGRLPTAALAGHPVAAAPAGQDVVFVSLRARGPGDPNGIEVLRRGPGGLRSAAVVRLGSGPAGLALSPDGRVLLAALDDGVAVLDAGRAAAGDPSAVLGVVPTGPGSGTVQLAIADNRYVFTADEAAGHVTVLALPRMEAGDFGPAVQVATIDVDMGPAGLGVSPDGRYVYVVSQVRRPVVSLGPIDFVYGLLTYAGLPRRAGTLSVVDVRRMELDPASAVVARVPAGCGPVRVAASPDGRTVWVTARQSNELLAFRTDQVLAGRATGPVARVPIASAPEGLGVVGNGRFVLVAGSDGSRTVSVVDTAAALGGRQAVRSAVTVGGPPQEIDLTADRRTAYVVSSDTSTLTTVDLTGLPGS